MTIINPVEHASMHVPINAVLCNEHTYIHCCVLLYNSLYPYVLEVVANIPVWIFLKLSNNTSSYMYVPFNVLFKDLFNKRIYI